jgi:hypothetical protein
LEEHPSDWVGLLFIQHSILFGHGRLFLDCHQELVHFLVVGERQALVTCLCAPENCIIVFSQLDMVAALPILLSLLESQKSIDHAGVQTFVDKVKLILPPKHVFVCQLSFREINDSNPVVLRVCRFKPLIDVLDLVPVVAIVLFGEILALHALDNSGVLGRHFNVRPQDLKSVIGISFMGSDVPRMVLG